MAKLIAFYLPQFHTIPENDYWYGKGFTEWTNVAKAKPLFPGHYQPHVPADLGFYDLKYIDNLKKQVEMAKEYKIDAFCYWHYWFENNKQVLEMPFNDFVSHKEIEFDFCLGWDNSSWTKRWWTAKGKNEMICEQKYNGITDYSDHFYTFLNAFNDKRYLRINDKLFFCINKPFASPEISVFIKTWRELAKKEGLNDFFFVARDNQLNNISGILQIGFDGIICNSEMHIRADQNNFTRAISKVIRNITGIPNIYSYKKAIKHIIRKETLLENVFPTIIPGLDHSPRNGKNSLVFVNNNPKFFSEHLLDAYNHIKDKTIEKQIIMINAWNEWGEGMHLEPDLKYGLKYLEVIKNVREEYGF